MVIVQMAGGLGNQLFKYAFGRLLALKLNTELKFDLSLCEESKDSHHEYYRLGVYNIPQNFATPEEIASVNENDWVILNGELKNITLNDNVYVQGTWLQQEYFFIEIADIVRREVTLKEPLTKIAADWEEKILAADCPVSVHIRLGDYLSPAWRTGGAMLLPCDYFDKCIAELKKFLPSFTLFVFSDDMKWAKENLKFNLPTHFIEGCEYAHEEMHLMSLCKHNIMPMSSFSWWGAWLNKNPDKKVFMPEWYNCNMANHMIKIPLNIDTKPIVELPPLLSFVIYVENGSALLELVVRGILFQPKSNCEIILVDASTDDAYKICRHYAGVKNVTVLTVSRSTNKFSAWNKGLNVARGDYVLFLNGKDIVLSQAERILTDICQKFFEQYSQDKMNYLTYETYDKFLPNIICTIYKLESDDNGAFALSELPDQKFSIQTDGALINLNVIQELNLTAVQKLMGLAMQGINNSVGTKFFKRKFLSKNNIKFSESVDDKDKELLFLVDTFLATDKIVFSPQLFWGHFK